LFVHVTKSLKVFSSKGCE